MLGVFFSKWTVESDFCARCEGGQRVERGGAADNAARRFSLEGEARQKRIRPDGECHINDLSLYRDEI